jgi:hypothetical protein
VLAGHGSSQGQQQPGERRVHQDRRLVALVRAGAEAFMADLLGRV